ncbi:hypothetical protein SETIT_8G098900v2 [Setaria italica]|uniref:WRKY domain-containing protein n=1 Tax=Setaria italica TaxID=4555 RepID=A0A368S655_SETIT|nr:hypothetical protein SETIT_8G098900v2 [Setaria italica]
MAYVPDRDGAMREVVQAYELIKSHQPHFQFCDKEQGLETVNLAQSLLNEALRALHLALSVLNHETSTAGGGAEGSSRSHMLHLFSRSDAAGDVGAIMSQQRRSKRRRSNEETSQVILTDAPHDDGYIWRKYGEKKINGTHFTRNYFRCSYKYDRGCQATKQIQQQSSNDLPIFQVTYNSEHTCNCTTAANKYIKIDVPRPHLSSCNPNGMISPMADAMIDQNQGVLPPLVEVSTVFFDSTSCQETSHLSRPYTLSLDHVGNHLTSTDDGAGDYNCGTIDAYIDLGQMVLPQEPLEDNPFSDAELDLLCNSLMYN